jgi:hypothetical protein
MSPEGPGTALAPCLRGPSSCYWCTAIDLRPGRREIRRDLSPRRCGLIVSSLASRILVAGHPEIRVLQLVVTWLRGEGTGIFLRSPAAAAAAAAANLVIFPPVIFLEIFWGARARTSSRLSDTGLTHTRN